MSNNKKTDVGQLMAVLGAGLAAGAVIGTAMSHEKTREKIKDTTSKMIKKAREMKDNEPASVEQLQAAADDMKAEAKKRYEGEKKKIDDFVSEKKESLS